MGGVCGCTLRIIPIVVQSLTLPRPPLPQHLNDHQLRRLAQRIRFSRGTRRDAAFDRVGSGLHDRVGFCHPAAHGERIGAWPPHVRRRRLPHFQPVGQSSRSGQICVWRRVTVRGDRCGGRCGNTQYLNFKVSTLPIALPTWQELMRSACEGQHGR